LAAHSAVIDDLNATEMTEAGAAVVHRVAASEEIVHKRSPEQQSAAPSRRDHLILSPRPPSGVVDRSPTAPPS
jgi:hypothetical protein